MDQRLSMKLGQRLVLTPTLQQAIKLLQLSRLELVQQVRQELLENPILDELQEEPPPAAPERKPPPADEEPVQPDRASELPDRSPFKEGLDLDAFLPDDRRDESRADGDARDTLWTENIISTRQTLQDYLLWQLHLTLDDETDLVVGEELIGNIDDDGYLGVETGELAQTLGLDAERVERVLATVQAFDPPGVGARGIEECLLLQLSMLPERNPLAEEIVRHHLKKLENRNFALIAQQLKTGPAEVAHAAHLITGLEPKPGRLWTVEEPEYITPDIFIVKDGNGYLITLNDVGLPRLRINGYYRRLMSGGAIPDETRDYLQKKFSSALWLIKSIHQRQKTIFRVAESIVRFQRAFFDLGIEHLRPLVLRQVAEDIGVHESTVSRVTTRKYAQTPQGLYELKFFFNSAIEKNAGTSMASVSVQNLIRGIVAGEDTLHPLSDHELAQRLRREHNLIIARRTIAKYRGILRILPANKRRRADGSGGMAGEAHTGS